MPRHLATDALRSARLRAVAVIGALVLSAASITPAAQAATAGVPAGTTLQDSGSITVTKNGTVVDAKHVKGYINVKADNVTIKRTKITYGGYHSIRIFDGADGTKVIDSTVQCTSSKTNGLVFGNYRAERVAVSDCRNSFMLPATVIDGAVDGVRFSTEGSAPAPAPTTSPAPAPAPTTSPAPAPAPTTSPAPAPAPATAPTTTTTTPAVVSGSKADVMRQAGPRYASTATLSGSEARQRVVATGLLDKVTVNGFLDLSRVDRPYTIRDVTVKANGSRYGIQTMVGYSGVGTPKGPQVIEHVEVHGASSAGLYLRNVTVRNADVWGNIDNVKSADNVTMTGSWLHDQAWTDGAHADAIQIQYGTGQYFANNVIDAHHGDSSVAGSRAGQPANAALQTGSMLGDASARFHSNWFDGGYYTVRLGQQATPVIDYQFRNNRFGRSFQYGPVTGSSSATSGYGGVFFDRSNVWEDTSNPI